MTHLSLEEEIVTKNRHPVLAMVFAMGAFFATSAVFNIFFIFAAWITSVRLEVE